MTSTFPRDLKKLEKRSRTKKISSQIRTLKRLIIPKKKKPPLTIHIPKLHNVNELLPRKTPYENRQENYKPFR